MSRETELLPSDSSRESALFFVVAALCFLAVLAALTAKATYGAATNWTSEVEGEITIQLVDADPRDAADALDIVLDTPGVASAEIVPEEELKAMVKEAMNVAEVPSAINSMLPVAIAANGGAEAAIVAKKLKTNLTSAGFTTEIGVAADWVGDARRALGVLRLSAFVAVALLSLTGLAVIAFATHAALLAQKSTVNVLHLSGATDRFVANLFERRFWLLGLRSGAIGALAALGATAFMIFVLGSSQRVGLLPQLSLDLMDFLVLLLTPIIAGVAARFAARQTVMRTLAEAN